MKIKKKIRPFYKKLIRLRKNILNNFKIFKFKKKKWQTFKFSVRKSIRYKSKIYKFYNLNISHLPNYYDVYFSKTFKSNLHTKQRLSLYYGSLKRKYFRKTVNHSNVTNKFNFLFNLERRLDVILYRAHFIARVRQASQLIEHGHIYVNKKIVKNKSILLKPGDVIECSKNLNVKRLILYNIAISKFWPYPPKYLNVNYRLLKISVLDKCSNNSLITQFPFFLNVDKVTRYYKTY